MMRRLELLVNEVRESTDTTDINSVGIYEIMRYFNDVQKLIQKIIYTANPSADIFVRQAQYNVSHSNEVAYDLPFDIYAHNSVTNLNTTKDNRIAQTLTRVAYREKSTLWGYALLDKQFVLTTPPEVSTVSNILLNYVRQLPVLSYRLARISSIDTNTGTIVVDPATLIQDRGFADRYDKYTIVDSNGVQKAHKLTLDSYAGATFTFSGNLEADTDFALTGAEVGDWIICGNSGTTHSLLPEECEPFLLSGVQKRITAKLSSSNFRLEALFSETERMDIEDLFKDTVKDPLYPVTSDSYYLGY